jgi:glutaredoxin-like protein NrdH
MVQVYGKPQCIQCEYTKKRMDANDGPYEYHDVTADDQARMIVEQSGQMQLPFVIADDESWHGFKDDKIKKLAIH